MLKSFSNLAVLLALIGSFVAIPAAPASAQGVLNRFTNRLDVPVTGVVQDVGTIAGTMSISRFAIRDGTLVAVGQLSGTVRDTGGNVVRTIITNVNMPVTNASGSPIADAGASCDTAEIQLGSCDILNLVLGPLHLDLLGLVIDLNQVILNITGQTGAGNLLGNLLCAITGLLNQGALGQQLVNLLNQLLGVLAGL